MLRLLSLGLACWFALLGPLPALAQPPTSSVEDGGEPPGYRAAIDAAVQEYELNHFAESREHVARAHALFPNARTLRGLGMADFELRHYVDAVKELEAALTSPARRLDAGLRTDTEALLGRARAYVGEAQLTLEPPDASVMVDGVAVGAGGLAGLMLEVGDHELEVSAPGRATQRRTLRVRGQQTTQLRIALPAAGTPTEASAAAKPTQAADRPRRRVRVITWVLGGLTVAASGALLGLAIAVENTDDSFHACLAENGICEPLAEQGNRLERARNAMIGVAGAAAVATLVSFFVEGRAQRKSHVSLRVSPGGAQVMGTF